MFWEEAWIAPIPAPGDEPGHIVGIKEDITARKGIEYMMVRQAETLGAFAAHLESVREDERTAVSREVHDAFGQILSAIKLDAIRLGTPDMDDPEHTARRVSSILALADSGMKTVHEIAARLRPGILDNLGLIAALEWQLEDFQKRTGINCVAQLPDAELELEPETATVVFRCAQALLTNVSLHAQAHSITFSFQPEASMLVLSIVDDGIGITDEAISNPRSFGLVGIRERLRPLGGVLGLRALPSGGTDARITLPLI